MRSYVVHTLSYLHEQYILSSEIQNSIWSLLLLEHWNLPAESPVRDFEDVEILDLRWNKLSRLWRKKSLDGRNPVIMIFLSLQSNSCHESRQQIADCWSGWEKPRLHNKSFSSRYIELMEKKIDWHHPSWDWSIETVAIYEHQND